MDIRVTGELIIITAKTYKSLKEQISNIGQDNFNDNMETVLTSIFCQYIEDTYKKETYEEVTECFQQIIYEMLLKKNGLK